MALVAKSSNIIIHPQRGHRCLHQILWRSNSCARGKVMGWPVSAWFIFMANHLITVISERIKWWSDIAFPAATPLAWLKIHFGFPCASGRSIWKSPNIASSIIIFVERCRRPRTQQLRSGLWFHSTICLETTKHYIMLVKLQIHIQEENMSSPAEFCAHGRIIKHPHNREKNCTPNFSPSLDRNSSGTEISSESDGFN